MPSKSTRESSKKKFISPEQRARKMQSILFSVLVGIMILSMLVALVAR